jgi:endonuclease III
MREHSDWRDRAVESAVARSRDRRRTLAAKSVDRLSGRLVAISLMLDAMYGTPDLGNKPDPVDELVYIMLSRRTRESAYQGAYGGLKQKYASWEELVASRDSEIFEVVRFSGLGFRKAQSLKRALGALIERFGRCTLAPTRDWTDDQVTEFLCSLPEIGPKSAACIMMCALDRPAFPVDAHVGRVLERLGIFQTVGIDLEGLDHKAKQRLLWDAVPPALRYSLHVNLLVHGRETCIPRASRCSACGLLDHCSYGTGVGVRSSGR